jgi:sensor histidine kinase YesM
MKVYKTIFQHLLFWLSYILYEAVSTNWNDTDRLVIELTPSVIVIILPVTIILTYINLYILMPLYYYRRRYVYYCIALFMLLLSGGLLMRFFTHEFILPWEKIHNPIRYARENKNFWIPVRILRLAIQAFPVIAITMLIQAMRHAFEHEKKLREAEQQQFSAELGLLKAQINPHFLFNTLNSLYALTLKGSDRAAKLVLRLSDLMHYMLYDAGSDKVLLNNEIKYLENYISIEQMRFVNQLELSFQYAGDTANKMIAPLLLLPFVENAFKHGIGWITIQLNVVENRLFLTVQNSSAMHQPGQGLGLKNVRRRLELIYPDNYTLNISSHDDSFEINLKINL